MPAKRTDITKELLTDLYINQRMTYVDIARELKTSFSVVGKYIHEYEIPLRKGGDKYVHPRSEKRLLADKKHSEYMKGRKHSLGIFPSEETKRKMSKSKRRIYISDEDLLIYNDFKYKNQTRILKWSRLIKELYGNECSVCKTKEKIVSHHKNCLVHHQDEAFNIDNGVPLCSSCHTKHHNWLHFEKKSTATKELFEEWLGVID